MIVIIQYIRVSPLLAEPLIRSVGSGRLGMSNTQEDADQSERPPESPLDSERYAHLSLDDDAVVIYDREQPDTWLQSDFVVEIGA